MSSTLTREKLGELIYRAHYEHEGGLWRAVEPVEVWYGIADRLLALLRECREADVSDVEWLQRKLVALDVLDPENDASAWELVYYASMTEDAEVIKVVHGETLVDCIAQARRGEGEVQ